MIKRIFDFIISFLVILLLFPFLLVVVIILFASSGRPIFFRQVRPGMNGVPFEILKFRTMSVVVDSNSFLLSDKQRLTRYGNFLRSTSIDELPELWNVLKGEMSLVGPRPLLMEYLPLYSKEQYRRHEVRPGITGWAQVNGRNAISWEEKFRLDIWYVDNHSIWLDIKILALTIKKVLRRNDIDADIYTTMKPFKGTK